MGMWSGMSRDRRQTSKTAGEVTSTPVIKQARLVLFGGLFVAILLVFTLSGLRSTNQHVLAGNDVIVRGGIPSIPQAGRAFAKKTPNLNLSQARKALVWRPKLNKETKMIFLRLPKTGSRTLGSVLMQQVRKRGFTYRDFPSMNSSVRRDVMNRHRGRVVFASHMRYMEFNGKEQPIYLSMTRDPIARIISNFYYHMYGDGKGGPRPVSQLKRQEMIKITGNTTIPTLSECILRDLPICTKYGVLFSLLMSFCGEDPRCLQANNWTYARAVQHIDSALAVGLTEEFEDYLRVLERLLPSLFQGIVKLYHKPNSLGAKRTKTSKTQFKEPLSPEAEKKLRGMLEMEYRIFNYTRDRFHQLKMQLGIV